MRKNFKGSTQIFRKRFEGIRKLVQISTRQAQNLFNTLIIMIGKSWVLVVGF